MPSDLYIGSSGWAYADWVPCFYPRGVRGAERLTYYAQRYNTVEVNATFYRFPSDSNLLAWNARLPASYATAVKASRRITHAAQPPDPELTRYFMSRIMQLSSLRGVLFQLAPYLRFDPARLAGLLGSLPAGPRYAVEFRHLSWWTPETVRILADHNVAFVAVSHPALPDEVIPTADFLYVRFHGLGEKLYVYDYSDAELDGWVRKLAPALHGREAYLYFNNCYAGRALRNANTLRDMLTHVGPDQRERISP
jgi:uncharacterized protein YecE (DUF72 family)